jgi:multiple sugar transport system permease protein
MASMTTKKTALESLGKPAARFSREKRFVFISLTPLVLLFIIFFFIPIIWGIILGFYEYSPLNDASPFVGLANYKRLFTDAIFLKSLWVTFKFVAIAVSLNLVITLLIAIGIQRMRMNWMRDAFRTIFFLPTIAPLAGVAVIWATIFNRDNGLFNMILIHLHMQPINWLSDPKLALLSLIMMTLWADSGYNIVILMAGIDSIPVVYYEAAKLEGANRWQVFWNVTYPLLNRTTIFVSVTTIISYFQAFAQFQVLTKGGPINETRVLALNIYDNAFSYSNMGYASAMATVLLVIILIITQVQIRMGRSQWEH